MITNKQKRVRKQIQMVSIDDLVPQDHLLRIIDKQLTGHSFMTSLR